MPLLRTSHASRDIRVCRLRLTTLDYAFAHFATTIGEPTFQATRIRRKVTSQMKPGAVAGPSTAAGEGAVLEHRKKTYPNSTMSSEPRKTRVGRATRRFSEKAIASFIYA